jgi:AcrR family transcriptional regulator
MRPGSIYAGFGSKENLFKLSIERYVKQSIALLDEYHAAEDTPIEALRAFVSSQIFVDGDVENCRICLLVKTISESENNNPELALLARNGLRIVENRFSDLFAEAKDSGLISQHANCNRQGKWLQMQIMGLVMYAKGLADPEEVRLMIDDIFTSIS